MSSSPGPKAYNAPSLPYHQRPLPPGWISQFDPVQKAHFYIDEHTNPPTITWEDPRPAYYMALERGQYAPPPPGIQQGRHHTPQPQVQQQHVHTVQNSDGTITTITSNGQPIVIQAAPQQQQQFQQQARGPSLGRTLVGAAVVSSLMRPRRRRC